MWIKTESVTIESNIVKFYTESIELWCLNQQFPKKFAEGMTITLLIVVYDYGNSYNLMINGAHQVKLNHTITFLKNK